MAELDEINGYVNGLFDDDEQELSQAEAYMNSLDDDQDPVVNNLPQPSYRPPLYYGQQQGPEIPQLGSSDKHKPLSERLSGAAKSIGHGVYEFGKEFVNDLNVLEGGISKRERAYRIANVGAFFLPPLKIGQTAGLAARMGVRALEAGAITGALSAVRGQPVAANAGAGALIGAGIEGVLGKLRLRRIGALSSKLASKFTDPTVVFNKATTPLRDEPWAVLSASLTSPNNAVLSPEANAARTAALRADLERLGYQLIEAKGFAPNQAPDTFEKVFMVPGITRRHALELAKTYEQQGLLTNEGFFDLDRSTLAPIKQGSLKVGAEVQNQRTEMLGDKFSLEFDEPVELAGNATRPKLNDADDKLEALIDRGDVGVVSKALSLPNRFNLNRWYTQIVRSFAEVERMEKFLGTKTREQLREDALGPSELAQFAASWSSYAQHAWDHGVVDWKDRTKVVAPALGTLFSRLRNGEHEAFERYGFARRMLRLADDREFGLPAGLTRDDLLDIVNDNNLVNPHFGGLFDDITNWRNQYIYETLVKPGVLSEEAYKAITSTSQDFVPMRKVFNKASEQLRLSTFPNSKIINDPIDTIHAIQGKLKPWTESLVQDMYSFSKLAHQQDFVLGLIRELERNDPTAAAKFAVKIGFPNVELSRMQQEAIAAIAGSDPELARAAALTGEEAMSLLQPQKQMQRGLIGGLVPTKVKEVFKRGKNLGDIEIINKPAVKVGDEVFEAEVGEMHGRAIQQAIRKFASEGKSIPVGADGHRAYVAGFTTSKGRFVTRDQAVEIAQVYAEKGDIEGEMVLGADNTLRKNKWLDSGDLEFLNDGLEIKESIKPVRTWYKVTNENLWEALQVMNPAQASTFTKIAGAFASTLRAGATLAFEFMARNPIKDTIYRMVNAGDKGAFSSPMDFFIGGFAHAFKQDEVYQKWLAAGGGRATMVAMDRESIGRAIKQAAGIYETTKLGKLWNVVKAPVHTLQVLSDFMESGNRIGVYEQKYKELIANGVKPEQATRAAALASRNATVDFSIHGSRTQALRMITAFWNAQIQGYDNLRRSFEKDPFGAGMRAMAYITLPSTLLYLANRDDPTYFDLPAWERDMFWHVKMPDSLPWVGDKWVRIPKPFDLGVVFGSSVERFLQFVDQNDPKQLDAMMGGYLSKNFADLMPIPTVARPLIENAVNRSFLRNRPIESRALQDVAPEYRIQPGTSEIAQKLGQWLGESPVKIDNLFGGYAGGLGRLGADIIDAGISASEGRAPVPQRVGGFDPRDIPGLRGLFSQYPRHSDSVDRFYEIADEVRQAEQTKSYLQRTMQFDDLAEWLEHKALHLGSASAFREFQEQLKLLRQQRDLILRDKSLTSAERGRQLDVLSEAMNTIAASTLPLQQILQDEE